MVQFSQTSWQEYTPDNLLEHMQYAPMNVTIGKNPVIYYTLPQALEAKSEVKYCVMVGFKKISWTGTIGSVTTGQYGKKIVVRLQNGPFRGFNAEHEFAAEGSLTACYDTFSFQGFSEFPENIFAEIMSKANLVYAIKSRKDTRSAIDSIEAQKQTQAFEAISQSATAG